MRARIDTMQISENQLQSFLIDSGLVSGKRLGQAIEESRLSKRDLQSILISKGLIQESDLKRLEAFVLAVPFVDLRNVDIDFETLSNIPEPIARNHNVVAYKRNGNLLEVAMLELDAIESIEFISKKMGHKIAPRLTDAESIKTALLAYQKALKSQFGDIIQKEAVAFASDGEDGEMNASRLADHISIVRIVDTLLKHAIIQNASDIHIEPEENRILVRYRIDGYLHDAMILPASTFDGICMRIKSISGLELGSPLSQEGRFKINVDGERVSFRVSTFPTIRGERIVLRLLREGITGFSLESLGFHGENLEHLYDVMRETKGLILSAGPKSSGKTTTLYTMLDILNSPRVNIATLEDPVEYNMTRINQTEINEHSNITYAEGLRAVLKQDPDIIMISNMKDSETVDLALQTSLSRHLVFSSVESNSPADVVLELLDRGASPLSLASSLHVIIFHKLIRKLALNKEAYLLTESEIATLYKIAPMDKILSQLKNESIIDYKASWQDVPFYKPSGINGYDGSVGVHEVHRVGNGLKDLISRSVSKPALEDGFRAQSSVSMLEDGIFKAVLGQVSLEDVLTQFPIQSRRKA